MSDNSEIQIDDTEVHTESTELQKTGRFANVNKKKIGVGMSAGLFAFATGFGAAALFTGDDDYEHGRDGQSGMEKLMDQMMGDRDQHRGIGPGDGNRGGYGRCVPQRGQQPARGMPPSIGPNSGGQTWSHGS